MGRGAGTFMIHPTTDNDDFVYSEYFCYRQYFINGDEYWKEFKVKVTRDLNVVQLAPAAPDIHDEENYKILLYHTHRMKNNLTINNAEATDKVKILMAYLNHVQVAALLGMSKATMYKRVRETLWKLPELHLVQNIDISEILKENQKTINDEIEQ